MNYKKSKFLTNFGLWIKNIVSSTLLILNLRSDNGRKRFKFTEQKI